MKDLQPNSPGNGLKGQQSNSPGHRPGYGESGAIALKGQKHCWRYSAFALSGRSTATMFTQGVALGYELLGLSGRCSQYHIYY